MGKMFLTSIIIIKLEFIWLLQNYRRNHKYIPTIVMVICISCSALLTVSYVYFAQSKTWSYKINSPPVYTVIITFYVSTAVLLYNFDVIVFLYELNQYGYYIIPLADTPIPIPIVAIAGSNCPFKPSMNPLKYETSTKSV